MASVALFYAAIMLTIPGIYLATNVVSSTRCEKITCSFSADCPPWHYCNTHQHQGSCEPCTRCVDAPRQPYQGNCRDPTLCISVLYAKQDYACPKLRIAEGNSCRIECKPCGGTFGSYLGTTCRGDCSDGDWEVFSCIFLNEVAQWNVSRQPYWITYEIVDPTQPPSTPPPTSPPSTPTLPSAVYHLTVFHLETLIGIVVGTVLGVVVIILFAVLLVFCVRRQKQLDRSKSIEQPTLAEEPLLSTSDPSHLETSEQECEQHSQNEPRKGVENDDPSSFLESGRRPSMMTCSRRTSLPERRRPDPTELSDYNYDSNYPDGRLSSIIRTETWLKNHPSPSQQSSFISLVSLRSDPPRRPQQHSPPPVYSPPAGSSDDSGHPPGRCSSSNSLQHDTLRESVMDQERPLRRAPIEHSQETSSGFHPHGSYQDLNTSFRG